MKCNTRDFGEIEFNEQDIIVFSQPPFGFEEYSKYILIYDNENEGCFVWLQSVEEENLCFILLNTSFLAEQYNPSITLSDEFDKENLNFYAICVIGENLKDSTANLKSPIIISGSVGTQVVLSNDYPLRYKIMGE